MQISQGKTLVDRRKFLVDGSIAMAALAGSSVIGAGKFAWAQTSPETVEVKTAYGIRSGAARCQGATSLACVYFTGALDDDDQYRVQSERQPIWSGTHSVGELEPRKSQFITNSVTTM